MEAISIPMDGPAASRSEGTVGQVAATGLRGHPATSPRNEAVVMAGVGRGKIPAGDEASHAGRCGPRRIGLDETSFRERHEHVTVVTDLNRQCVPAAIDGRTTEAVDAHLASVQASSRESAEVVPMDMWRLYLPFGAPAAIRGGLLRSVPCREAPR